MAYEKKDKKKKKGLYFLNPTIHYCSKCGKSCYATQFGWRCSKHGFD